ncbi:MAG: carboxypeptidase-like regulatory domain-containing protein, partial [Acidobacteriota bacterium]
MTLLSRGRFALVLLLAVRASSVAQTGTGSLRGIVTDPSGSVMPGVTVKVSNGQNAARVARTDSHGQYRIDGLTPGIYGIHAEAPGFTPFEQPACEMGPGQSKVLDIPLLLRAQNEQVTVAADGAVALDPDPSSNAGALVLQKTDLDALPDDPDDLTADLQALAGPAAGPGGGQFFIDGFTGGRMPPKQSIREIRINQNPFAAQFDRPGQGRV